MDAAEQIDNVIDNLGWLNLDEPEALYRTITQVIKLAQITAAIAREVQTLKDSQ